MARPRTQPQREFPIDSVGNEPLEPTLEASNSPEVDCGAAFGSLERRDRPPLPPRRAVDEPERHDLASKADPPKDEP